MISLISCAFPFCIKLSFLARPALPLLHCTATDCISCSPLFPASCLPCTAAHDLYLVHENKVQHWNSIAHRGGGAAGAGGGPPAGGPITVMDVSGGVTGAVAPGLGQVQLCTLCARWVLTWTALGDVKWGWVGSV